VKGFARTRNWLLAAILGAGCIPGVVEPTEAPHFSPEERVRWDADRKAKVADWKGVQGDFDLTLFYPSLACVMSRSTGTFLVRRPDAVRWEATDPAHAVYVLDGDKLAAAKLGEITHTTRGERAFAEDPVVRAMDLLALWYAPDLFANYTKVYLTYRGMFDLGNIGDPYHLFKIEEKETDFELHVAKDGVTLLAIGFYLPQNDGGGTIRGRVVFDHVVRVDDLDPKSFALPSERR
jgi:hypothetical protein